MMNEENTKNILKEQEELEAQKLITEVIEEVKSDLLTMTNKAKEIQKSETENADTAKESADTKEPEIGTGIELAALHYSNDCILDVVKLPNAVTKEGKSSNRTDHDALIPVDERGNIRENDIVHVYQINVKKGYPMFLIYDDELHQWRYVSAKCYIPVAEVAKHNARIINEAVSKVFKNMVTAKLEEKLKQRAENNTEAKPNINNN